MNTNIIFESHIQTTKLNLLSVSAIAITTALILSFIITNAAISHGKSAAVK
jgi:hypothetical protein